ncbi:MAG: PTS sugar transporter subunit IIA [Deltaproteobacteria bacterium]|nr:PTS sugar transporter subunit IIA [Deltaproteobacteria bacterium]
MNKQQSGEERLLTVRELADYMQMNERTVLKLAGSGALPAAKIGGQWRFKREVIDAWLAEEMQGGEDDENLELAEVPDGAGMPLVDLLDEKSIISELEAKDKVGAIEMLAARAFSNGWLKDKPWFVGAVVEREALASTAMDGGVAFLHTRQRNAKKIARPFIVVGRSHQGIDFGAPDGKPTYLFFLLGLKFDKLHLPILGRLARILKRPEIVRTLRAAPTLQRIRDTLLHEDQRSLAASSKNGRT